MSFHALTNRTVLVVALVYGLLLHVATKAGLFGILLLWLVMLSLVRFAYAVLRDVARGHQQLPPPGIETMGPFGGLGTLLHSVLFVSLGALLATTPLLGAGAGAELLRWVLLVAVIGVFPASAAVMGMTNNLAAAVSPVGVLDVIRVLGADYFKLVASCAVLVLVIALVERLLSTSWVLGTLGEAVAAWGFLGLFLLIGMMLRAHRADFDLVEGLDDMDERADRSRREEWQKTLDRAYASARSGLPAEAYRTIKDLLASEQDSLDIHQWVFNRMLEWDDSEHVVRFGETFVERLWQAGRQIDALELAQQCRRLSPSFALAAPRAAELAAFARSIGRHRIADELGAVQG